MAEEIKKTSEFSQKMTEHIKEMMRLVEEGKDTAERGLIVISVNREHGDDHEEVLLSMTGRRKPIVSGLSQFAVKDEDMASVFAEAVKASTARMMLNRIRKVAKALAEIEEEEEEEKSKDAGAAPEHEKTEEE